GHLVEADQEHLRQPLLQLEVADPAKVFVVCLSWRSTVPMSRRKPAARVPDVLGECRARPARATEPVRPVVGQDSALEPLGHSDLQADEDRLAASHSFELVEQPTASTTYAFEGAEERLEA